MVVHIHEQHPMVIKDGKDRTSKGRDWQQHHLIHPWPMLFALPQALPQVFRHQQEAIAIIMDPHSAPPMLTWPGIFQNGLIQSAGAGPVKPLAWFQGVTPNTLGFNG